jgi:hypothetical protein
LLLQYCIINYVLIAKAINCQRNPLAMLRASAY